MIVAVSISSGYRKELRRAISEICADISLYDGEKLSFNDSLIISLSTLEGVSSVTPAVSEAGVISSDGILEGVVFKSRADMGSRLEISIPKKLSDILSKAEGDEVTAYFVGEKVKVRKFRIASVYESGFEIDKTAVVWCSLGDLQRVKGYSPDEASCLEIRLDDRFSSRVAIAEKAREASYISEMFARPSTRTYSALYDWMDLIDMNVYLVLLLMSIVAAFNMISGLLIIIMRSASTIGTLKALGMDNAGIARTFLRLASRATAIGLAAGNTAALCLCLIQQHTRFLKLDAANYFVSFVPISINPGAILLTDILAWALILAVLLIPASTIAKMDPSTSLKYS